MTNQQIITKVIGENQEYGLLMGNCEEVLAEIPSNSIGCVITSPPYWQMRKYSVNGRDADSIIGAEEKTRTICEKTYRNFRRDKKGIKIRRFSVVKPWGQIP